MYQEKKIKKKEQRRTVGGGWINEHTGGKRGIETGELCNTVRQDNPQSTYAQGSSSLSPLEKTTCHNKDSQDQNREDLGPLPTPGLKKNTQLGLQAASKNAAKIFMPHSISEEE